MSRVNREALGNRAFRASHLKATLDVFVTAAVGVAAVLVIWRNLNEPASARDTSRKPPSAFEDLASLNLKTSIADAPSVGNDSAPVVLLEYSDFECPFCARYASETFGLINSEFVSTGGVQYIFRNYPLERIHPSAMKAAHAARCAHTHGKFMEMRTHLFELQKTLAQMDWRQTATEVQLDPDRFAACLEGAQNTDLVAERREGARLGVVSTPSFLLGRREKGKDVRLLTRITGAQSFGLFKEQIQRAIAKAQKAG